MERKYCADVWYLVGAGAVHHCTSSSLSALGMHSQPGQELGSCGGLQHPGSHLQNLCPAEQSSRHPSIQSPTAIMLDIAHSSYILHFAHSFDGCQHFGRPSSCMLWLQAMPWLSMSVALDLHADMFPAQVAGLHHPPWHVLLSQQRQFLRSCHSTAAAHTCRSST